MAQNPRSRSWCFTLNNYSEEEKELIRRYIELSCVYGVIGHEVGEQGTPHLQGYLYSTNQRTLTALKSKMGPRVHLEVARGSHQEAADYCKKEDEDA